MCLESRKGIDQSHLSCKATNRPFRACYVRNHRWFACRELSFAAPWGRPPYKKKTRSPKTSRKSATAAGKLSQGTEPAIKPERADTRRLWNNKEAQTAPFVCKLSFDKTRIAHTRRALKSAYYMHAQRRKRIRRHSHTQTWHTMKRTLLVCLCAPGCNSSAARDKN